MPYVVAWAPHIQGEHDDVGNGLRHVEGQGLKRQRAGVEDVARMSVAGGGVLVQRNRCCTRQAPAGPGYKTGNIGGQLRTSALRRIWV